MYLPTHNYTVQFYIFFFTVIMSKRRPPEKIKAVLYIRRELFVWNM